jgi:hypothetical protein
VAYLFLVRSVRRLLLIGTTILVSACAGFNPFDPHSLWKLPPGTIDERLHLIPQDENQIYRLVDKASSQRITYVFPEEKNVIGVNCGENDIVYDAPRLTGDYFELERTGTTWRIVYKGWWMK